MVWGRVARQLPPGTFKLEFPTWTPFRAKPIDPPLGVGPTADIFGPVPPPGPPIPSPRLYDPFDVTPPPSVATEAPPAAPRAERVAPGYAELQPLIERLGVPPIELGRVSEFADAPVPWTRIFREGRVWKGIDEGGQHVWERGVIGRVAEPWQLDVSYRIKMLENILRRGTDQRGQDIDKVKTLYRRRHRDLTPQQRLEGERVPVGYEPVPLRVVIQDELQRLLDSRATQAPDWWRREQVSGKKFENEFQFLAVKDPATNTRVQYELVSPRGEKFSFPTKPIDPKDPKQIFVFGSNAQGVHGAGAARTAKEVWGAVDGVGTGLTGRSYALPTKRVPTREGRQFELYELENNLDDFFNYAARNPDLDFMFTPVGTGLGGYDLDEIATMIARRAYRDGLPPNVYFVDSTEEGTRRFLTEISRARAAVQEAVVYIDADDLLELEKRFFGPSALKKTKPKKEKLPELPALPAPDILRYGDPSAGTKEITSAISKLITNTVQSGNLDDARVLQAYVLRRLQAAKTPRAIVTALKDYQALSSTVERQGVMRVAFRDAIEQAMENLGALNKKVAADTYVYLAEEVIDARRLASYIEEYVSKADNFSDLLRARLWLDDTFVASKLSHPELLSQNFWSRTEARLLNQIDDRIRILRDQRKNYGKPQGEYAVELKPGMSDEAIRDMFIEAIATSRSLDELRLVNAMAVKANLPDTLYQDLAVMIRAVRPVVSARRAVPTRPGSRFISVDNTDYEDFKAALIARRKAADLPVPKESDIKKSWENRRRLTFVDNKRERFWEEGELAFKYEPYNPETMLDKATAGQREWILSESKVVVDTIRNTLDIDELRRIYLAMVQLRDSGKLSGKMWKMLEKEMNARQGAIKGFLRRSGLIPDSEKLSADELLKEETLTNLKDWAESFRGSRRAATRYWNDPDIARRDDLSDFVEFNPAYEELIHDANWADAAAGRRVRAYEGQDMFMDPFASFDDSLGQVSILRGDISGEIQATTNRSFWESQKLMDLIDGYIARGYDALERPLEQQVKVVRKIGNKEVEVVTTVGENLEYQKQILRKKIAESGVQDATWDPKNQDPLPFGTRRVVDPLDPMESRLEVFDFEGGFWIPVQDFGPVAARRATNQPYDTFSEAIEIKPENITTVFESEGRRLINAAGEEFLDRPLLRLYMPDGHGYAYRTYINASGSDVTVSIAVSFDTPGEKLTKRFANGSVLRWDFSKGKYVAGRGKGRYTKFVDIPHNAEDFQAQVRRVVDELNEAYRLKNDNPITVNLAGNGLEALNGAQAAADAYAFRLWKAVMEHPQRKFTIANGRSGGQGGYDEAMMKAFLRLNLPMDVTLPRSKFGDKVMMQTASGGTEYLSIDEFMKRLNIKSSPATRKFAPLRNPEAELASSYTQAATEGTWLGGNKKVNALAADAKYEVSSAGDKRFSAGWAEIDGRTIEDIYQVDIKGGVKTGPGRFAYSTKGNPPAPDSPAASMTPEQQYESYKALWRRFFDQNPNMLDEIAEKSKGKIITDVHGSGEVNQARAIHDILVERGLRVLPGAATDAKVATMPMYFRDGTRGMRMLPEHAGKSTMELIIEGKRTGTTRSSLSQFKGPDGKTLRVGDIVEFTDNAGKTVRVEVTKAPYKLPVSDDPAEMARYARQWSIYEGWDPAMYSQYAGQYQMQYKLLGS